MTSSESEPVHGPVHRLGPEWVLGADGVRHRDAARVILLDEFDRLLLVRGHDADQPERSWWFTLGGGIDVGEDARTAALREVREESGLVLHDGDLVGPVFTRTGVFDFFSATCRQFETIFFARIDAARLTGGLDTAGWTELERDVVDELRWWDLDDLERVRIEVFPAGLVALVRGLLAGWDGAVAELGVQDSPPQGEDTDR